MLTARPTGEAQIHTFIQTKTSGRCRSLDTMQTPCRVLSWTHQTPPDLPLMALEGQNRYPIEREKSSTSEFGQFNKRQSQNSMPGLLAPKPTLPYSHPPFLCSSGHFLKHVIHVPSERPKNRALPDGLASGQGCAIMVEMHWRGRHTEQCPPPPPHTLRASNLAIPLASLPGSIPLLSVGLR